MFRPHLPPSGSYNRPLECRPSALGTRREANRNQQHRIGYDPLMLIPAKKLFGLVALGIVVIACSSTVTRPTAETNLPVLQPQGDSPSDVSELYRQIGLLATPSPLAFVGKISLFATGRPDTTLVLVSISVPNRALTFTREGDRYRAPYEVKITVSRGNVDVASI